MLDFATDQNLPLEGPYMLVIFLQDRCGYTYLSKMILPFIDNNV